ncbi:MAG: YbaK/EbsC family protein [Methylacidiphilaceae bacterium]|nr:YbaK/EbsC family protein [Candidatus Methylacidiphilaceae bacterium]
MAIVQRLQHYLEENRIPYRTSHHPEAFTSQEVAAASHVSGRHLAKVVLVKGAEGLAMAVLPTTRHVNLGKLKALMQVSELALAKEEEFAPRVPDCRPGTVPPFGNLYGLKVYVDAEIARQPELVFQAGTHEDMASLAYLHFARLVQPVVGDISG